MLSDKLLHMLTKQVNQFTTEERVIYNAIGKENFDTLNKSTREILKENKVNLTEVLNVESSNQPKKNSNDSDKDLNDFKSTLLQRRRAMDDDNHDLDSAATDRADKAKTAVKNSLNDFIVNFGDAKNTLLDTGESILQAQEKLAEEVQQRLHEEEMAQRQAREAERAEREKVEKIKRADSIQQEATALGAKKASIDKEHVQDTMKKMDAIQEQVAQDIESYKSKPMVPDVDEELKGEIEKFLQAVEEIPFDISSSPVQQKESMTPELGEKSKTIDDNPKGSPLSKNEKSMLLRMKEGFLMQLGNKHEQKHDLQNKIEDLTSKMNKSRSISSRSKAQVKKLEAKVSLLDESIASIADTIKDINKKFETNAEHKNEPTPNIDPMLGVGSIFSPEGMNHAAILREKLKLLKNDSISELDGDKDNDDSGPVIGA